MIRRLVFAFIAFIALPGIAHAQTIVGPNSHYQWDQDAPDLASAQAYTYRAYVDTAAGVVVASVSCSGTATPFQCVGNITSGLTAGNHTVALTTANVAGESAKSTPAVPFVFVLTPATPRNVVVKP